MSRHKPRQQNNSSFGENISLEGYEGLIYRRVSSKRQELEGNGLQSQEKRCLEKLKEHNVPHRMTFSDSFTGGGDFMRRPAIREMLDYIDAHPHKKFVVVFDDLKRFARDVENHIKLKYAMKSRGVALLCANYNFEETPEGEAMELVSAIFNELERKQNKRQVVQKQTARLMNGYRAFPCVKGYDRVKDIRHGKIDVFNKDAPFVKEALEGFASMRFVHKIDAVRFLQENGVISKKQSADKGIATFDKMLLEVFYAGYIEYLPWEVTRREGHHEPLITLDVYEKNQRRLKQTVVSFVRQDVRDDFEVRGLVNCADCGKKYTGANSKSRTGKRHAYYKCATKGCASYGKSVKAKEIHEGMEKLLKEMKPCEEVIELAKIIYADAWQEEISNVTKEETSLLRRKNELESEIASLIEKGGKVTSSIVSRQYEKQIETLATELEAIEEETGKEYDFTVPNRTALDQVMKVLQSPYSVWSSYDTRRKQRFFSFIFESNLLYSRNEGYRTPNYSLPIRIFEDISSSKPVDVEVVAKTSNSLRTFVNEWSEFFKYNPPVFESDKLTLIS